MSRQKIVFGLLHRTCPPPLQIGYGATAKKDICSIIVLSNTGNFQSQPSQ